MQARRKCLQGQPKGLGHGSGFRAPKRARENPMADKWIRQVFGGVMEYVESGGEMAGVCEAGENTWEPMSADPFPNHWGMRICKAGPVGWLHFGPCQS